MDLRATQSHYYGTTVLHRWSMEDKAQEHPTEDKEPRKKVLINMNPELEFDRVSYGLIKNRYIWGSGEYKWAYGNAIPAETVTYQCNLSKKL